MASSKFMAVTVPLHGSNSMTGVVQHAATAQEAAEGVPEALRKQIVVVEVLGTAAEVIGEPKASAKKDEDDATNTKSTKSTKKDSK